MILGTLRMKARSVRSSIFLVMLVVAGPALAAAQGSPPVTPADTVYDDYHGVKVADPYRWLEDQQSPETRSWIERQNEYTEGLIGGLPIREEIAAGLARYLKVDAVGAPVVRGGRYFFSKRAKDQDLFVIYMREGFDGWDQPLIDPNIMAAGPSLSANLMDVSEDGTQLIYGIREGGQDEVTVRFYDVNARKVLSDVLEKSRYFGVSYTPDKKGVYYTKFTDAGPRIHYHEMGTDVAKDAMIFGEGYGPEKIIFGQLSKDGRYLLINVRQGSSGNDRLFLKDLKTGGPPKPITGEAEGNFGATFAGSRMVIQTNWKAPNNRILVADLARPEIESWKEIIPEKEHVIQGFSPVGGRLFVRYLENVVSRIEAFDLGGKRLETIELPGLGTVSGLLGEWDSDEAFFSFSSYDTPSTTFRYSVSGKTRDVWYRQDVPFESDRYVVKQVWYESKDGTKIPMFISHRKDIALDGTNPTYLTGYGGFNVNRTPGFSSLAAVWMEQGGVYAVPNLRGGGEFGEKWHEAGMLDRKQNVFDDFIAAAEWLIDNEYTSSSKLAIAGGSNGGLLTGAAVTQRPDLFGAVVIAVPLLDMLRYENFLVAKFWVPEYGTAQNPEQFPFLRAYSPYHNVRKGTDYPAIWLETGDGDTRVAPLHARKMTALLQSSTGGDAPIVLRYDTEAGHSGGLPVDKTIEDLSARLTFLWWQLGSAK